MNTSTLRGIFPDPKPVHRRNFLRENVRHIREMQGLLQTIKKQNPTASAGQPKKSDAKYRFIQPKVVTTFGSGSAIHPRKMYKSTGSLEEGGGRKSCINKIKTRSATIINKAVQTEKAEDLGRLYDSGVVKFPSPSVINNKGHNKQDMDRGDMDNVERNFQSLEDRRNYIRENIKSIRQKIKKSDSPLVASNNNINNNNNSRTQPPANYQVGELPKYLKDHRKEDMMRRPEDGDHYPGLVLLPEEERKEYLRVARQNYADLIKELNAMPVRNDTLKKRKRKIEIEEELKKIDEVIRIFQKPKVFVKAEG